MSKTFLAIFFSTSILFHVAAMFFTPIEPDNLSSVYRFLEKWAGNSYVKLLTVVLDDHQRDPRTYDVQRRVLDALNVTTKMVTVKHLMYLKYENMDRDYESFDPGSCVLLLFTDIDHLRETFNSPHLVSFWQPDIFYLLYDYSRRSVDWYEVHRFFQWGFEKLWRYRRIYKVMVFINGKTIRYNLIDFVGYRAKYFFNSSCDWYCVQNNFDDILMVNEPNDTDVSDFFEQRQSFNMYPMKISIFQSTTMPIINGRYSGMDSNVLEEVTKAINVTYILIKSAEKFGWKENGIFYGTLGHLVYRVADISFNQFFIKDYLTRQMEFSTAIGGDMLCIMVPNSSPIPDHLIIVKIFSGEAWLLIFLGYFIILTITMMMKDKRNPEILEELAHRETKSLREKVGVRERANPCPFVKQNGVAANGDTRKKGFNGASRNNPFRKPRTDRYSPRRISRDFLSRVISWSKYLVEIYLQMIHPLGSKQTWFPQRLILMCCMLMSVILNGVFTSQLASSLSKRTYYADIETLEQLDRSGLPILINSRDVIDDVLTDSASPMLEHLRHRLQYANDSESDRRLFATKDAAVLHRRATIPLKYDEYVRKKKAHVIKECPKHYMIGYVMTKGSPFRERINTILGRLNNGGFYVKWYEGMFQSQTRLFHQQKPSEQRKITIGHLLIPFVVLQLGLFASTIVFICEYRQNNLR